MALDLDIEWDDALALLSEPETGKNVFSRRAFLQAAAAGPPADPGQLAWLNAGLSALGPTTLAERDTARVFPVTSGPAARLAGFRLPVSETEFGSGIQSSFSCVLTNSGQLHLPGGDANIYKNGEYVGRFRFAGISSGRSRAISMGM